jgi:hypothetical protein
MTTTAEALLQTGICQQLVQQAKQFMLSREGLPFSLTLGAGALAAMIANQAEVPSLPEIELAEGVRLQIDLDGPITKPKGIMVRFSIDF